jgi:hypothetical protein
LTAIVVAPIHSPNFKPNFSHARSSPKAGHDGPVTAGFICRATKPTFDALTATSLGREPTAAALAAFHARRCV